jgi:perosamine synthetase
LTLADFAIRPQTTLDPHIPLTRPGLGDAEVAAAQRVLCSGWLTQGAEVRAFEDEFAAFVGADHAIAVCNAAAALEVALHALGVGPGGEVVTISHSFIATANVVRRSCALPLFVDIAPGGLNIDAQPLEAAIGPKTQVLLAELQIVMPCDLAALAAIAQAYGVPLLED